MNNKELKQEIKRIGFEVGIIDRNIKKLTKKDISDIIESLGYKDSTDFQTRNKKNYIMIAFVDREIDIQIMNTSEYENLFF